MMMHNEPNRDTAEERSSTDFGGESKYVADDDDYDDYDDDDDVDDDDDT